jgi:signal transduction histidine kinase
LWWWISRRVHRSISQINVILKDATLEWEQSLAQLRMSEGEDLGELQERVKRMVERMQVVTGELDEFRREAIQSERLAAVGELAAGVAHELRNPLTSVKLLLQHAAAQKGDTRLPEEESRVVLREISRMERTIQGLLDLSRPPSSQRVRHDLRDTLQRAQNLVQGRARQQRVDIAVDSLDSPLMVNGDSEQLHQVCVNLLINGIESMPGGGVLEVHAGSDAARNSVCVHFRDHGTGIPEEVLDRLFTPFVSTKLSGTGLGLTLSRRIAEQHGGTLTAQNHPEGGAVVSLELPLEREPESDHTTPSRVPAPTGAP